ncbi:unnamed protein product, partial [Rotaria sordida]
SLMKLFLFELVIDYGENIYLFVVIIFSYERIHTRMLCYDE